MTPLKQIAAVLAAVSFLSACQPASQDLTATPTATLVPYRTSTATASRTPLPELTGTEPSLLPSATPFVHKVEKGDTLLAIALRYGLALDQLLAANPDIDPRFLSLGQDLRIPGPDGQPSDTLLPTSTPLPLPLQGVECYPTVGGGVICLATLVNDTGNPLEGLAAQISLLSPDGEIVASQLAFPPLNLLPPDQRMPLSATFDELPTGFAGARATLLSAFESTSASERYLGHDLQHVEQEPTSDGSRWDIRGTLALDQEQDVGEGIRATVVATGLDADGNVVGFAKWESDEGSTSPWSFSTTVFSLGPRIERVQLLAEAVAVQPEQP
ncbi:MAG: LysM peptidoglycan-binding domain-containing protein [Anaerolineales bacterium]